MTPMNVIKMVQEGYADRIDDIGHQNRLERGARSSNAPAGWHDTAVCADPEAKASDPI